MGLFVGEDDSGVQAVNEEILKEETEGLVSGKMSNIRDSVSSIWDDSSSLWSHAVDDPNRFWRQLSKYDTNKDKDVWESFAVNASDAVGSLFDVLGLPGGYGNPNRIRHLMDDPFTSEEMIKQGVTGLYSYKTPTESQFSECQAVGGLSAWNTKGWWRCLFPESVVAKRLKGQEGALGSTLTKEKVENDKDHTLGLFFPEYTGFLNWRLHMNQLIKQKKLEKQQSQSKLVQAEVLTPESLMFDSSPSLEENSDKNVVGTSQSVTFNYTPEGQQELKKVKTYYDNGTVLVKSEKKVIPKDGTEPKIEMSERIVQSKDDRD